MALYMDIHRNVDNISREGMEKAHQRDLEVQGKYGVKFLDYWYSAEQGAIFCLCDAPSREAAEAVHKEAHGAVADEIIEVRRGAP